MVGYVAIGSNLGDRRAHLRFGIEALSGAGLEPLLLSSVWETEPIGCREPLWFLNMVVKLDAPHAPHGVLDALQAIERAAGRVEGAPNAPRTLDLDLLLLGDLEIHDGRLELPHPRMWQRAFVLEPLAEVAPELRNPASGRTVVEERRLAGAGAVRRIGPLAPRGAQPL